MVCSPAGLHLNANHLHEIKGLDSDSLASKRTPFLRAPKSLVASPKTMSVRLPFSGAGGNSRAHVIPAVSPRQDEKWLESSKHFERRRRIFKNLMGTIYVVVTSRYRSIIWFVYMYIYASASCSRKTLALTNWTILPEDHLWHIWLEKKPDRYWSLLLLLSTGR